MQETYGNLEYIALGDIPRDEAIAYTRYRLQGGPGKRHMRGGAKAKHTGEHAGAVFSGGVAVAAEVEAAIARTSRIFLDNPDLLV